MLSVLRKALLLLLSNQKVNHPECPSNQSKQHSNNTEGPKYHVVTLVVVAALKKTKKQQAKPP